MPSLSMIEREREREEREDVLKQQQEEATRSKKEADLLGPSFFVTLIFLF